MSLVSRGKRVGVKVWDSAHRRQLWIGTFDTEEQARRAEREAEARLTLSLNVLGDATARPLEVLFSFWADEWWAGHKHLVRPTTRKDYEYAIRRLTEVFGRTPLAQIDRRAVSRYSAVLADTYAPCTARKTLVRLQQILDAAVEDGLIVSNPMSRIQKPSGRSLNRPRVLEAHELSRLIDAAPDWWKPCVMTAAYCGLRRGELFGCTTRWLDLERLELQVEQQLLDGVLSDLKTPRARRTVPVPAFLGEVLKEHMKVRKPNRLDLVFTAEQGGIPNNTNFYGRVWHPTTEAAGLKGVRLHDLRHTYGSSLIRAGLDVQLVADLLGHSSAVITLRLYSHEMPFDGQEVTKKLVGILGQPK